MKLRGKDYCNCDHAQQLRLALEQAQFELRFPSGRINAANVIRKALDIDNAARIDLWGSESPSQRKYETGRVEDERALDELRNTQQKKEGQS